MGRGDGGGGGGYNFIKRIRRPASHARPPMRVKITENHTGVGYSGSLSRRLKNDKHMNLCLIPPEDFMSPSDSLQVAS
jgi:hypothetical protein